MAKVTGTGGGRVTGTGGRMTGLASSLAGKASSVARVGGGVQSAARSVASRMPGSGVSRAPVSLPAGPKVPSGSGGRLYSESAYSDGKIASSYRDLVRQGASPDDAVGILRTATRMSPQPRTTDEIRRIVGLG